MLTASQLLAFLMMVSATVIANLLMKSGAGQEHHRWLLGLLGTRSIVGIAFFGLALILYAWILRWVPLNVAQSLMAGQYVAVILASAIILAEPISGIRWVGICLIAAGIALVSYSAYE